MCKEENHKFSFQLQVNYHELKCLCFHCFLFCSFYSVFCHARKKNFSTSFQRSQAESSLNIKMYKLRSIFKPEGSLVSLYTICCPWCWSTEFEKMLLGLITF